MKIVSIFWLYMSCDHLHQLPMEPFEKIKVSYFDGEREQSLRIQYLLEESLKSLDLNNELYQVYQDKLKSIERIRNSYRGDGVNVGAKR